MSTVEILIDCVALVAFVALAGLVFYPRLISRTPAELYEKMNSRYRFIALGVLISLNCVGTFCLSYFYEAAHGASKEFWEILFLVSVWACCVIVLCRVLGSKPEEAP